MIKAVLFDYGGVIKSSYSHIQEIADAYDVPTNVLIKAMTPIREVLGKGNIAEDSFWQRLSSALQKATPKNAQDLFRENYHKTFHLYPEMVDFARMLKEKGLKTAVLSNTIEPHVEIIERHKGYDSFDEIVLSCRVGIRKPNPRIYLLATEKLGVQPTECIFTDDKQKNLAPAQKLGMQTVLAQSPQQIIGDISHIIEE